MIILDRRSIACEYGRDKGKGHHNMVRGQPDHRGQRGLRCPSSPTPAPTHSQAPGTESQILRKAPCWQQHPKWRPSPPDPLSMLLYHSSIPQQSSPSTLPHDNGPPPYRLHTPKPEGYAPSHIRLRQILRFLYD